VFHRAKAGLTSPEATGLSIPQQGTYNVSLFEMTLTIAKELKYRKVKMGCESNHSAYVTIPDKNKEVDEGWIHPFSPLWQ